MMRRGEVEVSVDVVVAQVVVFDHVVVEVPAREVVVNYDACKSVS